MVTPSPQPLSVRLDVKEKLGYIALDFDTEMREVGESSDKEKKTHELPDDNIITVGSERFRCYESETASCRLPTFVKKKHN